MTDTAGSKKSYLKQLSDATELETIAREYARLAEVGWDLAGGRVAGAFEEVAKILAGHEQRIREIEAALARNSLTG